jgi:biopolymer transport protein TolR
MPVEFTPRQRSYIRKRTSLSEADASEVVGELNIIPFLDIVVNLIMFLLVTAEFMVLISQIESDLPKLASSRSQGGGEVATPLNLNVTITETGVLVSGSGGKLAPGCANIDASGSRSITVPRKGKEYDWNGLTACAARIKAQFVDEQTVTISADPEVQYEYVVAAMDAMRRDRQQELFAHVLVSVGIR